MSTQQTTSSFDFSTDLSIQARIEKSEYPHRDADILHELYIEEELDSYECADKLGCSQQTVLNWLEKNDIDTRSQSEAQKGIGRVERAAYSGDGGGHWQWNVWSEGECKTVGVHRLLAIAEGADPHRIFDGDTECHHRNGVPWDNRPENIEVVDGSEHQRAHKSGDTERKYDSELGCSVVNITEDE